MWSVRGRDRARRLWSAFAEAASIASFLVVAAPAVVALAGAAAALTLGDAYVASFLFGGLCMLAATVLILFCPLRGTIRRLLYGFRLRAVTITLQIDAGGQGLHRRMIEFAPRIIRTGARRIPDRYCQPGPSPRDAGPPAHAPQLIEGHGYILGPIWDDTAQCWVYEVDLGSSQSAGAEPALKVAQWLDFRDVAGLPHLKRTILDPTDFLSLCLKLPECYWPLVAYGEEVLPAEHPRRLEAVVDREHGEIRLEVPRPHFGSVYCLRWTPVKLAPLPDQPRALQKALPDNGVAER